MLVVDESRATFCTQFVNLYIQILGRYTYCVLANLRGFESKSLYCLDDAYGGYGASVYEFGTEVKTCAFAAAGLIFLH